MLCEIVQNHYNLVITLFIRFGWMILLSVCTSFYDAAKCMKRIKKKSEICEWRNSVQFNLCEWVQYRPWHIVWLGIRHINTKIQRLISILFSPQKDLIRSARTVCNFFFLYQNNNLIYEMNFGLVMWLYSIDANQWNVCGIQFSINWIA